MHTNQKLLISMAVLIVLIAVTWMLARPVDNSVVGRDIFKIADTTAIERIEIADRRENAAPLVLKETKKVWRVNDKYAVDPSVMRALFGRLALSRVKQKVGASRREEVSAWLEEGKKISVQSDEGDRLDFFAAGNPAKTDSYVQLAGQDEIYQLEVPGYSMYLSGIFELTENQWRNRLLFESDWRSIQSLTVDYSEPGREDIEVYFDKTTLKLKDGAADTLALENYIAQFERFYTNEYISPGQIPLYDSLMKTEPVAVLRLQDINETKSREIRVFPTVPGNPYLLLGDEQGNYSVVEKQRFDPFLPKREELLQK